MKIILVALAITLMAGCGQTDKVFAKFTGKASRVCMEGVLYWQFTSGASVAYNKDGTVKKC